VADLSDQLFVTQKVEQARRAERRAIQLAIRLAAGSSFVYAAHL